MATEYEVDRMVVRLIGDQKSYQKMLQDVEKQTKDSAEWAEQQGSRITNAFTKAFEAAQGFVASTGQQFQKAGAASMAGAAAIQAPLGKAALDFSEYGKSIKDMVVESEKAAAKAKEMKKWVLEGTEAYKELNKIVKLNVEQAATFRLMSERTGESIEDLTKTIKTNSKEYETWRKEAEKFGLILSKDQVKAADDLAESWQRVKEVGKGLWVQVGAAVAPMWKEFNDLIAGSIQWVIKWVKENQELIKSVAKFAEKLMVVGGALTAVGTVLTTISTLLGPIVAAVTAGAAAWLAWDTATGKFLQGSAMQVWEQYGETVKKVVNQVMEYGREILAFTDKVMTGVFNAVKAGNLELAVDILWSGAKVAWIKSLNEIDKLTGEKLSGIFQNLAAGNWKSAMEAATTEIVLIWTKLLQMIDPILVDLQNTAAKTWANVVNTLDAAMVEVQNTFGQIRAWFEDAAQSVMNKWVFVETFFQGLTDTIEALWGSSFKIMIGVAGAFVGQISGLFGQVKDVITTAVSGLGGVLGAVIMAPIKLALDALSKASGLKVDIGSMQEAIGTAMVAPGPAAGLAAAQAAMDFAMSGGQEQGEVTTAQDVERTRAQGRGIRRDQRMAERAGKAEAESAQRIVDLVKRQAEYAAKIAELEEKRTRLIAEGQADAAQQLQIQQEQLETSLQQAEAEAKKAEAERANARETQAEVMRLTELREKETQRISKQEQYKDQFDPVFKYMKDLKQLNAAFLESERSARTYQLALKAIKQELVQRSLSLEINVSMTGLDSVAYGSSLFQEAARNAANSTKLMRIEREKLGQVEVEQSKLDKEAAQAEPRARLKEIENEIKRLQQPNRTIEDSDKIGELRKEQEKIRENERQELNLDESTYRQLEVARENNWVDAIDKIENQGYRMVDEPAGQRLAPPKPASEPTDVAKVDQNKMLEKLERIAASTEKTAQKPTYQVETLEIMA